MWLHDNEDGTLSELGYAPLENLQSAGRPPVVVSRGPSGPPGSALVLDRDADGDNDDERADDTGFQTPSASGDVPVGISEAEPGRPYNMWRGEGDAQSFLRCWTDDCVF